VICAGATTHGSRCELLADAYWLLVRTRLGDGAGFRCASARTGREDPGGNARREQIEASLPELVALAAGADQVLPLLERGGSLELVGALGLLLREIE